MTASTSPLVDVIAGVLETHLGQERETWNIDPEYFREQARAVLDALTEAGGVEWGVRWPFDDPSMKPLEAISHEAAKDVAKSLGKITPDGHLQPVAVSRFTGPWVEVASD